MKKISKIIIIYLVLIGIGIISAPFYYYSLIQDRGDSDVFGTNLVKVVNVNNEKIFDVMADIENYPNILPDDFISVKIINHTKRGLIDIIFAEERVTKLGIETSFIVKHTIVPYDTHIIEVKQGNAKDTKMTIKFSELDSGTNIRVDAAIRIQNELLPIGWLLNLNLKLVIDTLLTTFVEYAQKN